MTGRGILVAACAALLGVACQTVDLGHPPADINACRPSQSAFVTDVWTNVLAKSYGGKKCSDATCHDPSTGRPLSLVANPQPAMDPANPMVPLTGDWAMNYRSATEQMSCSNAAASNLVVYPTATRAHGGGKLFDINSAEAQTIEMWATQ